MNCGLCGLPKDTGAIGSVLPQCICHWKHTPYTNTSQELNDGGKPVKNATYWKKQHDKLLMKLNISAIKIAELEKVKTLTDEEIWEVIDNCFGVHAFNLDYQIALDEAREDAFELVKAILRKVQEK